MRCLVTGSTGFIGSHLSRALLDQGHAVRAFHRRTSSLAALHGLRVEYAVGDVFDRPSLQAAMEDVDWVFHAAAEAAYWRKPKALVETSVVGTRNVLQAAQQAGVARVIHTSSLAALGVPGPGELLDERHEFNSTLADWPYGYAKHAAELEVRRAVADGMDCVILNPSAVLGAGDLNLISGSLIIEPARRWIPFAVQGGLNLVHVCDVMRGHLAAAEMGRCGERYILGGENVTHLTALRTAAGLAGRRPPLGELPVALTGPLAAAADLFSRLRPLPLDGDLLRMSRHYFYCDTSKARAELGLSAPIPFRQAAHEAYSWYRDHGYL